MPIKSSITPIIIMKRPVRFRIAEIKGAAKKAEITGIAPRIISIIPEILKSFLFSLFTMFHSFSENKKDISLKAGDV